MNTKSRLTSQLMFLSRQHYSLYNYSAKSNPRVFLTVSKNGSRLGDLVFEVYHNHTPKTAENFIALATGANALGKSYKGTTFTTGAPGVTLQAGRITECNQSADGGRFVDENLSLRHIKRGQLTMANDGENANGSEFMITLGSSADVLDGYHTVFGELVEGEEVLSQVEAHLTRHGTFDSEIKIDECGTR